MHYHMCSSPGALSTLIMIFLGHDYAQASNRRNWTMIDGEKTDRKEKGREMRNVYGGYSSYYIK